jgi:hypothetical protein
VTEASTLGWTDPRTVGMLAVVTLAAVAFLVLESRVPVPLLPLRMLRSPCVLSVNLTVGRQLRRSGGAPRSKQRPQLSGAYP